MRASLLAVLIVVPSLSLTLSLTSTFADPAPTEPELMRAGQQAYLSHDYELATQTFTEVLEMDPQNTTAIAFLRRIRADSANSIPAKDPISGLIITKINFKDATFTTALDYFKGEAKKQGVDVSFVSRLSEPMMENKVTLNLSQIPFLDALRYLCTLNHALYKVDPYAIEILPEPDAASAAVPPSAVPAGNTAPASAQ